jgi:hypothetical protein
MQLVSSLGGQTHPASAARAIIRARSVSPSEIALSDVRAWIALESEAILANAYMSPLFVLPALRHLDPSLHAKIVLIERIGAGATHTIGVAVIHRLAATRLLPVPHHCLYLSRHSYLGAPLLHREFAAESANALFEELAGHRWTSAGLAIPHLDTGGSLMQVLRESWSSRRLSVYKTLERQRAFLIPAEAGPSRLKLTMQNKVKDLERRRRRLAEQGDLEWRIHRQSVDDDVIESFLRLEHDGWKGRSGTSLRSRPADEAFFREMASGFAREGRAFFTELRMNDQAIASTSNFVSGRVGFAFKVGWDESYRKFGLGILNEVELVRQAPEVCSDLSDIDSGAAPDSYIADLWPHRRELATVFLPCSSVGQLAWAGVQSLRSARRSVGAWAYPRDTMQSTAPVPD